VRFHNLCAFSRLENEEESKQKLAAAELIFRSGALVFFDAAKYELIASKPELKSLLSLNFISSKLPIKFIQFVILN
jgi:hypothetical protein